MAKLSDLINNNYSLSPSSYGELYVGKTERIKLKFLLDRELDNSDKGYEIGNSAYVTNSSKFFMRAKALQRNSFIPILSGEAVPAMNRKYFVDYHLQKGDILISKDSNIGECVVLSNDLPNYMPCGAIYRLPISKNRLYVFAMIKSDDFRMQLDKIVPKGATIRHAGKKFLECTIAFPKTNSIELIRNVESLVRKIIDLEQVVQDKNAKIYQMIENELVGNCEHDECNFYNHVRFSDINKANRLDAGYYAPEAKWQKYKLMNYKNGVKSLEDLGYVAKRGQNLQISAIGKSLYSPQHIQGFYTVIKPTNFSNYGTVEAYEYLGNKNNLLTLEDGDIVFSAEGTVGKCILFVHTGDKWITNIHGIILRNKSVSIIESAYISCFLRFLADWGYYDHFTVGGQGGSLGKSYWNEIYIPNFPQQLKEEIATLYYNPSDTMQCDNYERLGILQLATKIGELKSDLNNIIKSITCN